MGSSNAPLLTIVHNDNNWSLMPKHIGGATPRKFESFEDMSKYTYDAIIAFGNPYRSYFEHQFYKITFDADNVQILQNGRGWFMF